jgi:hypothetical protein
MNLEILAFLALIVAALPCGLFLANLSAYRRLPKSGPDPVPPVSVLIPARNEERNLRATLEAVLACPAPALEVIVLDDQSTDGTAALVAALAARDPRVRLETAPPLPAGWCGKPHACHVLAGLARHPWLIFLDADVRLAPDAIQRLTAWMAQSEAGLASGVPRQETGTLAERLLIPLIHFILLGFLPLRRMRQTTAPAFAAGCGQLFIARSDAYQECGGHAGLRESLHDGLRLPRAFRQAGWATDLFDATDLATCRMYCTNAETWRGLGKNATEGLAAPARILPFTLLLGLGQILPFVLLLLAAPGSRAFFLAALASGLALLPRLIAARRFRQSWAGALLHPLGVLGLLLIQWQALARKIRGRPMRWKNREYPASPAPPPSDVTRLIPMLALATLLAASPGRADSADTAAAATNWVCSSFDLSDQFGTNHSIHFPQSAPMILIISDRKGSDQIAAWVVALKARCGQDLPLMGVADIRGAPGWVQGLIRRRFRQQCSYPILLDASGRLPAALPCRENEANVFLLDTAGRVLASEHGECAPAPLERLARTTLHALQEIKHPQADKPAPRTSKDIN